VPKHSSFGWHLSIQTLLFKQQNATFSFFINFFSSALTADIVIRPICEPHRSHGRQDLPLSGEPGVDGILCILQRLLVNTLE